MAREWREGWTVLSRLLLWNACTHQLFDAPPQKKHLSLFGLPFFVRKWNDTSFPPKVRCISFSSDLIQVYMYVCMYVYVSADKYMRAFGQIEKINGGVYGMYLATYCCVPNTVSAERYEALSQMSSSFLAIHLYLSPAGRLRLQPRQLSGGSRYWRSGKIDPPTISRPRLCWRISGPAGSVAQRTRRPSAASTRPTRFGCDDAPGDRARV